ncbi:hypothetical protein BD410DRAFT_638653 [Rickenella mellea]|uniref:Uncharacterized protein n=1 Tax=Rickenella mellea TaxID=50990 RepID=A0A4Y7QE97_9AGAM|nr:hypothetical protein BD410DRAFT_638653 [Rickenella mellea]
MYHTPPPYAQIPPTGVRPSWSTPPFVPTATESAHPFDAGTSRRYAIPLVHSASFPGPTPSAFMAAPYGPTLSTTTPMDRSASEPVPTPAQAPWAYQRNQTPYAYGQTRPIGGASAYRPAYVYGDRDAVDEEETDGEGGRRDDDRARYGSARKSSHHPAYPAYGPAYPPRHPHPHPGSGYANAYASYPSPAPYAYPSPFAYPHPPSTRTPYPSPSPHHDPHNPHHNASDQDPTVNASADQDQDHRRRIENWLRTSHSASTLRSAGSGRSGRSGRSAGSLGSLGSGSASDYTQSPRTPSWHLGDAAYAYGEGDGGGEGYGGGGGYAGGGSAPTSPTVPSPYYGHGFGFGFGFEDEHRDVGGYARSRSEGYPYPPSAYLTSGYAPSGHAPSGHAPPYPAYPQQYPSYPQFESPSELGDEFVSLPPTTPPPPTHMRPSHGMRRARSYAPPDGYGYGYDGAGVGVGLSGGFERGEGGGMGPTPITMTSATTSYPSSSAVPPVGLGGGVGVGLGLGLDTGPAPSSSMARGEGRERRSRSAADLRGGAWGVGATTSGMTMAGQRPRVDRSNTASSTSTLRSSSTVTGTATSTSSDATITGQTQRDSRNPRGQRDPGPFIHTALGWWPDKPLPNPGVRWDLSAAFASPPSSSRRAAAPSAYGYENSETLSSFLRQIPSAELDESPFKPPLERVRLVVREECGWVFDLHASSSSSSIASADWDGSGDGRGTAQRAGRRRRKHFTFATLCEAIASLMHRPVPREMYEASQSSRAPTGNGNGEGEGMVRLMEGWRRRVRVGVPGPGSIPGPSASSSYMPGVNPGYAHGGDTRFLVMDMLGRERTFWGLVVGERSGEWVLKTCV